MSAQQASENPFLPPEVRAIIWTAAFGPIKLSPYWKETCLPKKPSEPYPTVDDSFVDSQIPDKYRPCSWDDIEDLGQHNERRLQCSNMHIDANTNDQEQCDNFAEVGLYCWSCKPGASAILYTCKEAYESAIEVAYAKTTFTFGEAVDLLTFIRGVRSHGHADYVKHLELDLGFADYKGDLEDLVLYLVDGAMKKTFPKLETVNFDIAEGSVRPSRGGIRLDHFADAAEWDSLEQIMRSMARPFAGFEKLKITVTNLAREQLADILADGVRTNVWNIPYDPESIARQAQHDYRKRTNPEFWFGPFPH